MFDSFHMQIYFTWTDGHYHGVFKKLINMALFTEYCVKEKAHA
jgi:hypothetical protein